ncbi:MAG: DciA family protein [Nakamurella sp.]
MTDAGDETPPVSRGVDLAREALEQARQRTAARRTAEGRSSVVGRRAGGRRRRWSGPGPDARDPAPFGALAQQWVKRSGSAEDLARATVLARWAEIVGDDLASHCTPLTLIDGQLTVQAESTAWATQIRLLAPTILGKVAAAVGPHVVRHVRATGPTRPSWRFGPRHVSGRGPRDTYG